MPGGSDVLGGPAPAAGGPPPAHLAPLPTPLTTRSGVRVLLGVPYAGLPGVRPLELDLYLPPPDSSHSGSDDESRDDSRVEVEGRVPVVVFLHGGGWRLGSRHGAGPMFAGADPSPFETVALAGIAVASLDYRLSGEAVWPAQIHDAKAAVRWLRSRATEFGIDADRIGAWGESAGGHLALLLGLSDAPLDGDIGVTGVSSGVAAIAAWYPPTDPLGLPGDLGADPSDATTREALLLGGPAAQRPDVAAQASPLTYASGDAVPTLLLHGEADALVPCAQSRRLAQALDAAGSDVELHTYPHADHMWRGSSDVASNALRRTVAFLAAHLRTDR